MKRWLTVLALMVLSVCYGAEVTLSSSTQTVRFADGKLVSLKNQSGRELLQVEEQSSLFHVCVVPATNIAAQETWILGKEAKNVQMTTQADGAVVMEYSGFERAPGMQVQCKVHVNGDRLFWNIAVMPSQDHVLKEVTYPRLFLAVQDADKDTVVYGRTKGGILVPSRMKVNSTVSSAQPGSLALQFGCQNNGKDGFYIAAQDSACLPKRVRVKRTEKAMNWEWSPLVFVEPGQTYVCPYAIVTMCYQGANGDDAIWQDAADIYRTWAKTQLWCQTPLRERKDLPQWLKEGPSMVRFSRRWFSNPGSIQNWITKIWTKHFPKTHLIAAMWGWEKVESWVTPDYFPIHGGNEAFKEANAFLHAHDAHPFPWPSGYHWTLTFNKTGDDTFSWDDRQRFYGNFKEHAIENADGAMYLRKPSWLRGGECTAMCPGDEWTINWWNNDICKPLSEMGCDIIQVDQVVGGNFPSCFSKTHGHPRGMGAWKVTAFDHQLKTMYQTMKSVIKDPIVAVEEPNEVFNHLVGVQDYRNCEVGHPWASVFNYVYHDYVPCFQSNPKMNDRVWDAFCAADGQIPHFVPVMDGMQNDKYWLTNSDMEKVSPSGNLPADWEKVNGYQGVAWNGKAESTTADSHSGERSLRLYNAKGEIVQVSRNISFDDQTIQHGAVYKLSAWLKTRHQKNNNGIAIGVFASGLRPIARPKGLSFPKPEEGWQYREDIVTVPPGGSMIRIMCHVNDEADVLVDDFHVQEQVNGEWKDVVCKEPGIAHYTFALAWSKAYKEYAAWLQHGVMLRPPKLTCATSNFGGVAVPNVFHNAFRAPDGREAVVLVNAAYTPQEVTLQWHGKTIKRTVGPAEFVLVQ